MIGLDTNIVVRLIVRDDAAQVALAAQLVRSAQCLITDTVLLETEWVLRAAYGYTRAQVVEAFRLLLSLQNVTLKEADSLRAAVEWHAEGMDFADATHLARCADVHGFATFDPKLVNLSERLQTRPRATELGAAGPDA